MDDKRFLVNAKGVDHVDSDLLAALFHKLQSAPDRCEDATCERNPVAVTHLHVEVLFNTVPNLLIREGEEVCLTEVTNHGVRLKQPVLAQSSRPCMRCSVEEMRQTISGCIGNGLNIRFCAFQFPVAILVSDVLMIAVPMTHVRSILEFGWLCTVFLLNHRGDKRGLTILTRQKAQTWRS